MFDRGLINPMLTGAELYEALKSIPEYDDSIRTRDKSTRLVALSDIYNVYVPSKLSEEIYTKLYLALIRSLNKKGTKDIVRQINENYKAIKGLNYHGIMGGADSFSIIGSSGLGKSSAISRAIRIISDTYIDYNNTKICPFVIAQCPFDSSTNGLCLEVLRKVDELLYTHYYANAIRSRATTDVLIGMISQVSISHIGVLIIDEIQHCAVSKNGRSFINGITQIINNSGVSICLVGTPECLSLFQNKLQLARRSMGLYYQTMLYDSFFEEFCRSFFIYQYTQQKTDLTDSIIEWLYEHSGGLVSVVVSLLHDAQEIAILSGYEKIDLKSLGEAYNKRTAMLHGFLQKNTPSLSKTSR